MSDDKRELARAGTIEITSKEGKAFLEKNLTEWKKPILMNQFEQEEGKEEDDEDEEESPAEDKKTTANKRGKKAKGGPKNKKAKMSKAGTMAVTAKEGAELLGDEKLGDTRLMTKAKAKQPASAVTPKRTSTMIKTLEEAKAVCGSINSSEGRKLRKRSGPPPAPSSAKRKKTPMKKAGTMVKTAKEGKEFLKRGRPKSTKMAS